MSLRSKSRSTIEIDDQSITRTEDHEEGEEEEKHLLPPAQSATQKAISQTLASTAHLANLLPTGTLLAFQLLTPILSNNGACDPISRFMTKILLIILAVSCFIACFTDSIRMNDGQLYYGFATFKGLWLIDYPLSSLPSSSESANLTKYRIRFIDFVHAIFSVLVFAVIALRDSTVLKCFYPHPEHETQEVLDAVPIAVGLICSLLFVVFPTRRHGIGYPVTYAN